MRRWIDWHINYKVVISSREIRIERQNFDFFDLVKVRDCTAKGIYAEIVNIFNNNNINYKTNLIGFAANGANVVNGCYTAKNRFSTFNFKSLLAQIQLVIFYWNILYLSAARYNFIQYSLKPFELFS